MWPPPRHYIDTAVDITSKTTIDMGLPAWDPKFTEMKIRNDFEYHTNYINIATFELFIIP